MTFIDKDSNEVVVWPCMEINEDRWLRTVERAGVHVAPKRVGKKLLVVVDPRDGQRIREALRDEQARWEAELAQRRANA